MPMTGRNMTSDTDIHFTISYALWTQRALIGEAFPALRAIAIDSRDCADRRESPLGLQAWIDGPIQGEDRESIQCVLTEITASLLERGWIDEQITRLDAPGQITADGFFVYHRYERELSEQVMRRIRRNHRQATERDRSNSNSGTSSQPGREALLTAVQRAMLGEVFPALRRVIVNWSNRSVLLQAQVEAADIQTSRDRVLRIAENLVEELTDQLDVRHETVTDEPSSPEGLERRSVYVRRAEMDY